MSQIDSTLYNEVNLLSSKGSSRATAYIDSNKILEFKDNVFVTYLDFESEKHVVRVKKYNKKEKKWHGAVTIDNVPDNHGGAAFVRDSKGYFHIVYGPHVGPFWYRKTLKPNNIEEWSPRISIGRNMTYPSLNISKDDQLYLLGRHSVIKGPWGLYLFTKKPEGDWSEGKELVRSNYMFWKNTSDIPNNPKNLAIKNGYARWNKSLAVSEDGKIHITFKNYEPLPRGYKLKYTDKRNGASYFISHIFSEDNGETWKSGGIQIKTPAYPKDLDLIVGDVNPYLVQNNYGISNLVLKNGKEPYFVFSKESRDGSDLFVAFKRKNKWKTQKIGDSEKEKTAYFCPTSIVFNNRGELVVAASSMALNHYDRNELWNSAQKHTYISLITLNNRNKTKKIMSFANFPTPTWLPSFGHIYTRNPILIFTQGESQSNHTKVYYLSLENGNSYSTNN